MREPVRQRRHRHRMATKTAREENRTDKPREFFATLL
jgi:hypothetical protein